MIGAHDFRWRYADGALSIGVPHFDTCVVARGAHAELMVDMIAALEREAGSAREFLAGLFCAALASAEGAIRVAIETEEEGHG